MKILKFSKKKQMPMASNLMYVLSDLFYVKGQNYTQNEFSLENVEQIYKNIKINASKTVKPTEKII